MTADPSQMRTDPSQTTLHVINMVEHESTNHIKNEFMHRCQDLTGKYKKNPTNWMFKGFCEEKNVKIFEQIHEAQPDENIIYVIAHADAGPKLSIDEEDRHKLDPLQKWHGNIVYVSCCTQLLELTQYSETAVSTLLFQAAVFPLEADIFLCHGDLSFNPYGFRHRKMKGIEVGSKEHCEEQWIQWWQDGDNVECFYNAKEWKTKNWKKYPNKGCQLIPHEIIPHIFATVKAPRILIDPSPESMPFAETEKCKLKLEHVKDPNQLSVLRKECLNDLLEIYTAKTSPIYDFGYNGFRNNYVIETGIGLLFVVDLMAIVLICGIAGCIVGYVALLIFNKKDENK